MEIQTEIIKIDSTKVALIEYINQIINLYSSFISNNKDFNNPIVENNIKLLFEILEATKLCTDMNTLKTLKNSIESIEKNNDELITNYRINKLSSREKALLARGYEPEDVIRYASFTEEQARRAAEEIFRRITANCHPVDSPTCFYIGGQPGCGKTTASMNIKNSIDNGNAIEIGIDNYRSYHPNYYEMEKLIQQHWEGKTPTENDSPGNDIADFTHNFAGLLTDLLTEMASNLENNERYNIILEWGMREPEGPLKCMRELKAKGYKNIVDFIAVHKNISLEACNIRADVMNSKKHIIRRVPESFHSFSVSTLPASSDKIYLQGYIADKSIDKMMISTRDGKKVWEEKDLTRPSTIYEQVLQDKSYSQFMTNNPELALQAYINEAYGFNNTYQDNLNTIQKM